MHQEDLKSKARDLLRDAEHIRGVLEGFKKHYKKIIMPDIRRSVLNDIEAMLQELMKDVDEKSRSIDSLIDLEEEEVWIRAVRPKQSSHADFDAIKIEKEAAEELVKRVSTKEVYYLPPEIFMKRVSRMKQRISDGELDDVLLEDSSLLIYGIMDSVD